MSGHSKWTQIKRKKGATDAKRGQLFSKLSKQITVASRLARGLEMAVAAAKAANMPKDNIDRAITKGQGGGEGAQLEEALYEIYGPGGTGLLVSTITDNTNRTIGEIRALCNKLGGTLAQSGAVQFLFDRRTVIEVDSGVDSEATQLALIESGIDEVAVDEDRIVGYGNPDQFNVIKTSAEQEGLTVLDVRFAWVPKALHAVGSTERDKLLQLMETLDDLDDVTSVETNADL